jgi:hypothetical protein
VSYPIYNSKYCKTFYGINFFPEIERGERGKERTEKVMERGDREVSRG